MKILVSIVIPTKNEEKNLETCLKSIKAQSYKNIEIIVVDNNSTDRTKKIAEKYTKLVYNKGPERSAQRNYGAKKSKGKYLLFIDADMKLAKNVVGSCIDVVKKEKVGGVIIPEKSYGTGFWAECKALERSFYEGLDWIEGPRFFQTEVFNKSGGYDEKLISGEDWDLGQRLKKEYKLKRIREYIYHNEGNLGLFWLLSKKYYYAKNINQYLSKKGNKSYFHRQSSILQRYTLFFSKPQILFANPLLGIGLIFMKTLEFMVGGVGYLNRK